MGLLKFLGLGGGSGGAGGGASAEPETETVRRIAARLERLDPAVIVHRLTGETYRALTVAPDWSVNKIGVHNAISRRLAARDTWQGRLLSKTATGEQARCLLNA